MKKMLIALISMFLVLFFGIFNQNENALAQENKDSTAIDDSVTVTVFLPIKTWEDSISDKLISQWDFERERAFKYLSGYTDANGKRAHYFESHKSSEPKSKWSVQVQAMALWGSGLNEHVGDELRYYDSEERPNQYTVIDNYMFEKKPFGLGNKSQLGALNGMLKYQITPDVSVSLEFFIYNVKKSLSGRVETPWSKTFWAGGVSISAWDDANLFGLYNEKWKSRVGPVSYKAWDYFKNWSIEAGVTKKTDLGFDIYGGVRYAHPETQLDILVNNEAYFLTSNFWLFENLVTLKSVFKSEYSLIGPVVGIQKNWQWGPFLFMVLFRESYLFGDGVFVGDFYDEDNIRLTSPYLVDGKPVKYNIILRGRAPWREKERVVVPVTDVKFETGIATVDKENKNKSIVFSVGVMAEFWKDLPVGPYLYDPWGIGNYIVNAPRGMGWRIVNTNIMISGIYASVKVSF